VIRTTPGKSDRPGRIAGLTPRVQSTLDQLWASSPKPRLPTRDVVIVVHGTFANPAGEGGFGSSRHWWQSGGSFTKALDVALQRHGSKARCNSTFDLDDLARLDRRPSWFGWSGDNSEVERRRGAYDLAAYIRALQNDDRIGTIHIVAHSHGGNVVRRAMRYLNRPRGKLGAVVCLGTPFLHFQDRAAWRRWLGRVHWPMAFVLAGIIGGIWRLGLRDDWMTVLIVSTLLFGVAISIWEYAATSQASSEDVGAVAVRFAHDEAIQSLRV